MIEKASQMEPLTYSTIKKSCNKVIVGKNYWKSIVIPTVMYGAGLYNMTKLEIAKLQTKEYDCYRTILGAKKSAAVAAVRGEIGSSLIETRLMESRLRFVRSIQNGNNNLVKEILQRTRADKSNPWKKKLDDYMYKSGIKFDEIQYLSQEEIKKKTRRYDNKLWKEELDQKVTLDRYRIYKKQIKQEDIYDNRFESILLFKARIRTLNLNIERRHKGGDTVCELCREGDETDIHFILECKKLSDRRDLNLLQKYRGKEKDTIIGELLFKEKDVERVKIMLGKIWRRREVLRKQINKEN